MGGVTAYEDPMLVTLYAPPEILGTSDLAEISANWDQLKKRRTFQVHTPDTMQILFGSVGDMSGRCE